MIDASRLKGILLTSGIKQQNEALYQVINQLIAGLASVSVSGGSGGSLTIINTTSGSGSGIPGMPGEDGADGESGPPGPAGRDGTDADANATLLTVADETASYPNSVQELEGVFIDFDDSVANQRTINGLEWSVLTDGAGNIIFASGDVVMTHIP